MLKNHLDNKYDVMKKLLIEKISAVSHVSLTFDIWTETLAEKSFLGITIHFLEETILK